MKLLWCSYPRGKSLNYSVTLVSTYDDGRNFESEDHRGECPVWVRQACWWLYRPILDLHGLEQFGQGKTWSLVEDVWVRRSQGIVSCLGAASFLVAVQAWSNLDGKTWSLVDDVWVVGSFRRLCFSWAARTLPPSKFWTALIMMRQNCHFSRQGDVTIKGTGFKKLRGEGKPEKYRMITIAILLKRIDGQSI